MAADNKNEPGVHHEKFSHAGEQPDRFVAYSEKMVEFSRRNAVTITLIVVTIVIGIIMIAKLAYDSKSSELTFGWKVSKYEYNDFQAAQLTSIEKQGKVENVLSNQKALCEANLDHDHALGMLVGLGTDAETAAGQFVSEEAANISLWAWNTIKEKFADSEYATAVDPIDKTNLLDAHINRMNSLLEQISVVKSKANFDPEGLDKTADLYGQPGRYGGR